MGDRPRVRRADEATSVLVAGEEIAGRIAVVELWERRGDGPPRHIHTREDEVIYVLAGRVTFDIDGEPADGGTGTCILLPRGAEHTYRVRSAAARLLVIGSPAGIEGYYRELGRSDSPSPGTGAVERLIAAAARHGVRITGPGRRPGRSPPA